MTSETDAGVMQRAGAGDSRAVAELYDRYAPVLLPVALRIVGATYAEDVLHDAFVSLPDRAKLYSAARGSVGAWLVILVRNLSIDRVRRRGRRKQLDEANAAAPSEAPAPVWANPEHAALAAGRRQTVLRALATLSPVHRGTLEMAFFEGLTYAEIAERERISLGTVKSRASRAMAALAEVLGDEGSAGGDLPRR
jgi:RNA polymerase sigma-70 factor (ECF subfamily)